ncbi:hypothetical protein DM867_03735 [Halosegnis rubeus]|uniref:Uncharacterized protein n=1 Tax=Halosegnis rubeus TaxID=2212850 RepID=A0A5N5UCC0_9EURY|nr:hypothetical protein [Halosegnis rubeus]KAB7515204.1 hypothetical protein DMP03_08115 [Halosegnis rubeus]KAB7516258.1 hypothetical protein DM867_03735 [Halosegnis rubeus]KAB7517754.1 hypothetical protein DP108_09385 [Halosegnis rubeus]
MNEQRQQALAVWSMLVVAFLVVGGLLTTQGAFEPAFVALYWSPIAGATLVGILPRPWEALTA